MYSPSPGNLLSFRHLNSIFSNRIAAAALLALFSLVLNISSAQADTRNKRGRAESEKSSKRTDNKRRAEDKKVSRRVEEKKRVDERKRAEDRKRTATAANRRAVTEERKRQTIASQRRPVVAETKRPLIIETSRIDNSRRVVPDNLTRKTALTYGPKPPEQPAKRPVLVNDITVASRVSDKPVSPVLTPVAPRTIGSASNFIPSIWPVVGPLRSGVGMRSNPFGGSSTEYHKGQDIAAPIGTPVMATADGTIIIAGWQRGYGWVVYIDHGNGITTRYGHLSRIDVEIGQTIRRGEQLGLVGSTGRSTGPHLHYEVRINGQPVSPLQYLPALPALTSARPLSATPSAQR